MRRTLDARVIVRLSSKDVALLDRLAADLSTTRSEAIRRSVRHAARRTARGGTVA